MASKTHTELIARGLILHQSHALMCRNIKSNFYYLPGGHIEFAESAADALTRELQEEAAVDIKVGPLLLTTEASFNDGKSNHHEINLVFHVEQLGDLKLGSDTPLPDIQSQESEIGFDWVDLAAVSDHDIRPPQIKAWLASGGAIDTSDQPNAAHLRIPAAPHLTEFEITPTPH